VWLLCAHQTLNRQITWDRALNYLLDTNVVSEWVKPRPDANVVRWLAEIDDDSVYLSVITFAEIRQGVYETPPGRHRDSLQLWLEDDLVLRFEDRILDVNLAVAEVWGSLMAQSSKMGMNLNVVDAFIAATAKVHAVTLVTRNAKHFEKLDIPLANPWVDKIG
jgi:predicted nucleic acid-binding protein